MSLACQAGLRTWLCDTFRPTIVLFNHNVFGWAQALRVRWAGIRSAHPQLFNGLAPTVSLSELPPSNRPELRLVIGPLPSADAAAKLCRTLERFRLTCQPTIFAGRHLALD